SEIVYVSRDNFMEECLALVNRMHNIKSLYYHYLNMAKKNWMMFIKDKQQVAYKKYLYVLRPLLILIHIQSENYDKSRRDRTIINDFYQLLDVVRKMYNDETINVSKPHPYQFTDNVKKDLDVLLNLKRQKGYEGPPLIGMNDWIVSFFD